MSRIRILPSVTTLPPEKNSNSWKEKIEEIKELNLKEASLFLTGLPPDQRRECYKLLEETPLENIPHVHLKDDMTQEELDYLVSRFGVEVFNSHPIREHPPLYDWSKHLDRIYIENTRYLPDRKELKEFAGLCLDFVHWENALLMGYSNYDPLSELVKDFVVGCGHLSPIKSELHKNQDESFDYDSHYMEELKEFDYFQKYLKYSPPIISIEVNNSLKDQLRIKKYMEDNILQL